jgi:thiamine-phosphate pyrophosphorylase
MTQQRLPQRLYLVTPPLDDTSSFVRAIGAALDAGDVAAVLLRLADSEERTLIKRAKAVADIVQRRDIALLLDSRPEIVARAGADGAHLTGIEAFTAALGTLKPERIAGAGGLHSRHDAMLAAEAGADYIMFGELPPYPAPHAREGGAGGGRPPFEAVEERVKWSAELLELPCVGYAASADEVSALARAGADFIALGDWIWLQPGGAADAVAAAAEILAGPVS